MSIQSLGKNSDDGHKDGVEETEVDLATAWPGDKTRLWTIKFRLR